MSNGEITAPIENMIAQALAKGWRIVFRSSRDRKAILIVVKVKSGEDNFESTRIISSYEGVPVNSNDIREQLGDLLDEVSFGLS